MKKIETKKQLFEAVLEMFALQAYFNSIAAGADWHAKGLPFWRAFYIEGVEFIDHLGWKWWKHKKPDWANAKMELVDMLHFCLCEALQYGGEGTFTDLLWSAMQKKQKVYDEGQLAGAGTDELISAMEAMVSSTAGQKRIPVIQFFDATLKIMSAEELIQQYVAKNALNLFRQEQGDKAGGYNRKHNGVEDNDVLIAIVAKYNEGAETQTDEEASVASFMRYIRAGLADHYATPVLS